MLAIIIVNFIIIDYSNPGRMVKVKKGGSRCCWCANQIPQPLHSSTPAWLPTIDWHLQLFACEQARSIRELIEPSTNIWWGWWRNTLTLSLHKQDNSEGCVLRASLLQVPTVANGSISHPLLAAFPYLSHFFTPLLRSSPPINDLHVNPCLRACFLDNQN